MIERPFPCTSDEVRAIRANLKTQSRSLRGLQKINAEPDAWTLDRSDGGWFVFTKPSEPFGGQPAVMVQSIRCPWGVAGDRLWVQETWAPFEYSYEDTVPSDLPSYCHIVYRVDCKITASAWRSSTQMPRWASRDTLENVNVRPERLQSITPRDCLAEGLQLGTTTSDFTDKLTPEFAKRWDSRHGKTAPWAQNKWVWRIEHRRVNER